jgi:hypothetical protein
MKRVLTVLLAVLLLSGCSDQEHPPQITFYYPRGTFGQYSEDSVIASEIRENAGAFATLDILNLYLEGPMDPLLINPFPEDIRVLTVRVMEDTVYVVVTDELSQLSGVALVLACTALGKTASAMAQTGNAEIRCESAKLNGLDSFIITGENILFRDTPPQQTAVPTGE